MKKLISIIILRIKYKWYPSFTNCRRNRGTAYFDNFQVYIWMVIIIFGSQGFSVHFAGEQSRLKTLGYRRRVIIWSLCNLVFLHLKICNFCFVNSCELKFEYNHHKSLNLMHIKYHGHIKRSMVKNDDVILDFYPYQIFYIRNLSKHSKSNYHYLNICW